MSSRPVPPRSTPQKPAGGSRSGRLLLLALLACLSLALPLRAEIQFDVFVGYDDRVREGAWFPVAFEILNDGPSVTATVLLAPEATGFDSQQRSFEIELPTGTRKREVIPVFSAAGRFQRFDARLIAPDGTILAERTGLQPKDTSPYTPILGALPRSFGGLPSLPQMQNRAPEMVASVARLQAEYLPANPLALEGLSAWYLNSERAADLRPEQVDALLAWIHGGGHLIVGIEQPAEVTASPWLAPLLPFRPGSVSTITTDDAFERWLAAGELTVDLPAPPDAGNVRFRNAPPIGIHRRALPNPYAALKVDPDFYGKEMPIVTGQAANGARIDLSVGEIPLIVSERRGRGMVTALAFGPEREPFRSWKNRDWFWAKLIDVPFELLVDAASPRFAGTSIDGLFGAMLDSRQVRKLPIAALLGLLVVYLVVIGPFDQWILKRLGKQMWTWVTFPAYVVMFSALIYFIGYRLRAGDLEWNELQVVDLLPRSEGATLRGRTWVSIYSPANARYRVASEQPFSTIRSELQRGHAGQASGRLDVRYPGKGFQADLFVPVWVSQLYQSDWVEAGPQIINGTVERSGDTLKVSLENGSNLKFSELYMVFGEHVHHLGALEVGGRIQLETEARAGAHLSEITSQAPQALAKVRQRGMAFGGEQSGQWSRDLNGVVLASFIDASSDSAPYLGESFTAPVGFDLNAILRRGDAIVFAWASGQGVAAPIHRFSPRRIQRDTVLRVVLPLTSSRQAGI